MTVFTRVFHNKVFGSIQRDLHTIFVTAIFAILALIAVRWIVPAVLNNDIVSSLNKYLGFSWPFFAAVLAFVFYVMGAWITELADFAPPRNWSSIDQALHWATEACPLVGLLTTFSSLLSALLVYGEAGPGQPDTQTAFITQFAIAFGSSIAGGVLALASFTLQQLLPEGGSETEH